jgi:hypothetical protein
VAVSHSITDAEVRSVKSLCQRPELDTAQQIAAGPYGEGLTAKHFAVALRGLRDKSIAYEEEGSWRLTPVARRDLCTSESPGKPREEEKHEETLPQTRVVKEKQDLRGGGRLTTLVR